ncbi:unnamed protein product, partial [Rotaria sp. Silwood1]
MKTKVCTGENRPANRLLHLTNKEKKNSQRNSWLNYIPLTTLNHLSSFLTGFDALAFAQCVSSATMSSERHFWQFLGHNRMQQKRIFFPMPRLGFYHLTTNHYIQMSSNRRYCRFIYDGFSFESLKRVMNCCNSNSFRTYVRLFSYSSHFSTYTMPIFSFFDYSSMYAYKCLNSIELQLFRICRAGSLKQEPITVENIHQFMINLNNRFNFFLIKNYINFSLFVLAGGAVLNCILINGFNTSTQDLDFFWLGGSWILFTKAIDRFKR